MGMESAKCNLAKQNITDQIQMGELKYLIMACFAIVIFFFFFTSTSCSFHFWFCKYIQNKRSHYVNKSFIYHSSIVSFPKGVQETQKVFNAKDKH